MLTWSMTWPVTAVTTRSPASRRHHACELCQGRGEVLGTDMVSCCGGGDPSSGLTCDCSGLFVPAVVWRPCPKGCEPSPAPEPLAPHPDPYCW